MAKETYSYGKRDLFIWLKRPTHMAKETYSYGKKRQTREALVGAVALDVHEH